MGLLWGPTRPSRNGIRQVRLPHTPGGASAMFADPNLVSSAGLVPVLARAERAGLAELADAHLSVPTDRGANAGLKVASLVAGNGGRCRRHRGHGPVAARRDGS